MQKEPYVPLPNPSRQDVHIYFRGRQMGMAFFQKMLIVMVEAEKRLTRTAVDEQDIAVLKDIRNTIAQADPHGAGKRFIKG